MQEYYISYGSGGCRINRASLEKTQTAVCVSISAGLAGGSGSLPA